jgi:hypothetical protein
MRTTRSNGELYQSFESSSVKIFYDLTFGSYCVVDANSPLLQGSTILGNISQNVLVVSAKVTAIVRDVNLQGQAGGSSEGCPPASNRAAYLCQCSRSRDVATCICRGMCEHVGPPAHADCSFARSRLSRFHLNVCRSRHWARA